jgi:tetratricopeptide (TPR) repeat protein
VDNSTGKFLAFDSQGELLYSKRTTANLGNCGISDDGSIALFETYRSETKDSDKIFIIDILDKSLINSIERPYSFNNVFINPTSQRISLIDHKGFAYEIDFEGNQTNSEEYERQIMHNGAVYDKLQLYSLKSDELKFKDKSYLTVLLSSLKDKDASYSFGSDKLYRMIGEYYYANNDIPMAIENWEKAIKINPRVGIKKKLDNLKSRKL